MQSYDVIIAGAGPSGIRCAEILGAKGLQVLLLEKKSEAGEKVCAGGITRKGFELMKIPDAIIERKVVEVGLHSPRLSNVKKLPAPIMYTVDRRKFAAWQLERLKGKGVEYRTQAAVTAVNRTSVIVNSDEEIGFRFLVGADGPNSFVRRHLALPAEKVLATVQYLIPAENIPPRMDIFLNAKYFHSWYAWSFPHNDHYAVGACCDPAHLSGKALRQNFNTWLREKGYETGDAKYQSYPISYDYRGLQFGNIFLAGEAAGLASGLTGEGIYQSLVSGEEVAHRILNEPDPKGAFRFIKKYNDIQHRFLRFSIGIGPGRYVLADLLILAMRNGWVNRKISGGFS